MLEKKISFLFEVLPTVLHTEEMLVRILASFCTWK